jgi:hypothetical protein
MSRTSGDWFIEDMLWRATSLAQAPIFVPNQRGPLYNTHTRPENFAASSTFPHLAMAANAAPGTGPATQHPTSLPPNQTLYIKNLNPKVNKRGTSHPNPSMTTANFRSPPGAVLSLWHIWYVPNSSRRLTIRSCSRCRMFKNWGNAWSSACGFSRCGHCHNSYESITEFRVSRQGNGTPPFSFILGRRLIWCSTFSMREGRVIFLRNWMGHIECVLRRKKQRVRNGREKMIATRNQIRGKDAN